MADELRVMEPAFLSFLEKQREEGSREQGKQSTEVHFMAYLWSCLHQSFAHSYVYHVYQDRGSCGPADALMPYVNCAMCYLCSCAAVVPLPPLRLAQMPKQETWQHMELSETSRAALQDDDNNGDDMPRRSDEDEGGHHTTACQHGSRTSRSEPITDKRCPLLQAPEA